MSNTTAKKLDDGSESPVTLKRRVQGLVVSDKMNKTITVLVERRVKHPLYGKYVKKSTKIHAHDELNECKMGDTVIVEEHRPISKSKSWKLVQIAERAKG